MTLEHGQIPSGVEDGEVTETPEVEQPAEELKTEIEPFDVGFDVPDITIPDITIPKINIDVRL